MTARFTALPLAALASVAILVAACGGGTATNAPATQGPATGAPATQGPASTDGVEFSFDTSSFHADQQLEGMFPDQIGGEDLTVLSMSGEEFMGDGASPELEAALGTISKQPSDLSVAYGGAGQITIIAFKVQGVPGSSVLAALFQAYASDSEATKSNVTLGGKSVTKLTPLNPDEDPNYVSTAQDVVFSVTGPGITDAQLNEVFSKLP